MASLVSLGTPALVTGGVVPPVLRVVATRGEIQTTYLGGVRDATNISSRRRARIFAGRGGIKAGTARITVPAFYSPDSPNPIELAATGYRVRAHIEVGGVAYSATFSSAPYYDVEQGRVMLTSDPISSMPEVAPDTQMWVLLYRLYAIGDAPLYVSNALVSPATTGEFLHIGPAGIDPLIGTPGSLTANNGWTSTGSVYLPPFAILGEPVVPGYSFVIIGASIEMGLADRAGDGFTPGGGYIRRGLVPTTGNKYAYISIARGAEDSAEFLTDSAMRSEYIKYGDIVIIGLGGGDFTANRPVANTIANLLQIVANVRAQGVSKVVFSRMSPKTNRISGSTGWTVENQVIRPGFTEYRNAVDAAMTAAGIPIIDVTPGFETPSGLWKDNYTSDGTHPLQAASSEAGPLLQPELIRVGAITPTV